MTGLLPGNSVVPFGKHKGEPVEVLLTDPGYMEWLLAQPWVAERFPSFHQIIINYGGEPADSPEHNQMQAAFLDDERCLTLARLLYPGRQFDRRPAIQMAKKDESTTRKAQRFVDLIVLKFTDLCIEDRRFEQAGWDVVYAVNPIILSIEVPRLPECSCGECDHYDCSSNSPCQGGTGGWCGHKWHQSRRLDASGEHCNEECPWHDESAQWLLKRNDWSRQFCPNWPGMIRVELKPDLGDDFPAVLRQVLRYPRDHSDRVCVIARRHQFAQVTWDQVVAMFKASDIVLLVESAL